MATNPNDIIINPNSIASFGLPSINNGVGGIPDIFGTGSNGAGSIGDFGTIFAPTTTGTGGIGGIGGLGGQAGGGLFAGMTGLDKLNLGLQGLSTIGGLVSSFGALNLARKNFRLQRDVLNTNLNNQITAYNTALDDKARSRAVVEGQSDEERDAYIAANQARR